MTGEAHGVLLAEGLPAENCENNDGRAAFVSAARREARACATA